MMSTMKRLNMSSSNDKNRVFKKEKEKKKKKKKRVMMMMELRMKKQYCFGSSLQKLFHCCQQVFFFNGTSAQNNTINIPSSNHVQTLCHILDDMKIEDVGLSSDMQFFKSSYYHYNTTTTTTTPTPPRVTSATIYKSNYFELCIFFLPENTVIPLHNHPEMTVFSKLLVGTMHVKSYDWIDPASSPIMPVDGSTSQLRLAKVITDATISSACNASVLYPTSGGNIHEVTAITPCAMLDVLGPPYSNVADRNCTYYKDHPYEVASSPFSNNEVEEKTVTNVGEDGPEWYRWLEETRIPEELEMEAIPYMGPKIIHHT